MQSQKKNQSPEKARGLFEVVNLGTPKIPTPIANLKRIGTPYIPFGDDNDFPQKIAELSRESATLGAILANKGDFAAGDGYTITGSKNVESWLKRVNKNQNIIELAELLFIDYYLSGNAYLRVARPINSKVLAEYSLEHLPQDTIRLSSKSEGFIFNSDWLTRQSSYNIIGKFPNFTPIDEVYEESIIHLKDYVPGFPHYGLPTYMGAVQYAKLEYLIGLYNNNQFDNQMLPSGILEVVTSNMEDESAKAFIKSVKDKYVGVEKGNNGKILVLGKDGNENKASFTPISQEQEGSFTELKQIATETIVTACQWFPSLAGIMVGGKLGSNQQVLQEFDIAIKQVSKLQSKFIQELKSITRLCLTDSFEMLFVNNKPGYVSKVTEKVSDSQLSMFNNLLVAAIGEADQIKKNSYVNSFVILFGFSEDEANSMIYGTSIVNSGN